MDVLPRMYRPQRVLLYTLLLTASLGWTQPSPAELGSHKERGLTYAKAGLLTLSKNSEMPQLNGGEKK